MEDEEPAGARDIRVSAVGKNHSPFKIPDNHLEVGRAWDEWLEDFEEETAYFEINEVRDKVSALKIYGGLEVKKLARNLPDPAPVAGDDEYKKLKRKLNRHFLPKKNKHHARYTFIKQLVAPCNRIQEGPEFRIPASRFRIPAYGFWIPTLWIPDSNLLDSRFHTKAVDSGFQTIVDSGFQSLDSGFQQQKFAGFRISDSGFSYMGRS